MKFDKTDKVVLGLVTLALGTSAAVGISNHNNTQVADKNTCALKVTMEVLADRVEEAKQPNYEQAVRFYRGLGRSLKPVNDRACDHMIVDFIPRNKK